jgi:hypothetical protein
VPRSAWRCRKRRPPAVAVEECDAHVGVPGRAEQRQLVEADPTVPVADAPDLLRRQLDGCRTRIDDDEVVAEAVHLQEGDGRMAVP